MNIVIIVEGKTEKAFFPFLREYLKTILAGKMPRLDPFPYDGLIPKCDDLKRKVEKLLKSNDYVLALTDVYTGTNSHDFKDADDAKRKMRNWVGNERRFHPHAAQYDFEAWLLPYWSRIQELAKHNKAVPSKYPEKVNHNKPPSHHIKEIFEIGHCGYSYVKPRDAARILRGEDLSVAIEQCSELKAFVDTIISLCV